MNESLDALVLRGRLADHLIEAAFRRGVQVGRATIPQPEYRFDVEYALATQTLRTLP